MRTTDVTCLQLWGTTSDTRERQLRQWQLWRWSMGTRWRWIYRTQLDYPCWLISVMLCQHGCLYFGTKSTGEWLDCRVIHEDCIQMNLQQTGCTLPPFARNRAWVTQDAQLRGQWGVKTLSFSVPTYINWMHYMELAHISLAAGVEDSWYAGSSAVGWRPKGSKLYG
jgi:hypothetical protein